jgi:serine/threonine-protein kinase
MEAIMSSQMKQTPLLWSDETIDLVPPWSCRVPGDAVANHVGTHEPEPTSVRLAAGGIVWLVGIVALFLRNLDYLAISIVALTLVALATSSFYASKRKALSLRQIGQYRLISLIGSGGMGEVYLAEHRMLKRSCAIKLIRPDQVGDARALARFEREARLASQLSHWNTVEIFDCGRTADGGCFYVMEYLPGMSLDEILQADGPQPPERVVHLLRQICQALSEAHSIGLIHRDIKPANLIAAKRGGIYDVLKVIDFGLVKSPAEDLSARLTQEGAFSGTPLYMSPEQASGNGSVDGRSDIYSVGAVAYALLCGQPPFERSSPMEVLIAHARDEVRPPSEWCVDIPADLEQIVLRCLAKRPEDRFQNMDELGNALSACESADQWPQECAARWWRENEVESLLKRHRGLRQVA